MRRHKLTVAALVLVLLAAFSAHGADKIAYIDSERIRSEYEGAKDIGNQLAASVADWKTEAREMESAIEAMIVELQSQRLLLSDEASREKEWAIQEKQLEYEAFLNDVWGVGGLAVRREAELWGPVIERINAILEDIGTEDEYLLILDAAQGGIVYAAPSTDITQEVIDRLNGETE